MSSQRSIVVGTSIASCLVVGTLLGAAPAASAHLHRVGTTLQADQPDVSIVSYRLAIGSNPGAITAGSDGALWFTNGGGASIGRITTSGAITDFVNGGRDKRTDGDCLGIRRGPVVHELSPEHHWQDHHEWCGVVISDGWRLSNRHHCWTRRGAVVHITSRWDRADDDKWCGDRPRRGRHKRPARNHHGNRRGDVVHRLRQRLRSGGSPLRA